MPEVKQFRRYLLCAEIFFEILGEIPYVFTDHGFKFDRDVLIGDYLVVVYCILYPPLLYELISLLKHRLVFIEGVFKNILFS